MISSLMKLDSRYSYQESNRSFGKLPRNPATLIMKYDQNSSKVMPCVNKHWKIICVGYMGPINHAIAKTLVEFQNPQEYGVVAQLNKNWRKATQLTFEYVSASPFAAKLFALKCLHKSKAKLTHVWTFSTDVYNINFMNSINPGRYAVHCDKNIVNITDFNSIKGSFIGFDTNQMFFQLSNSIAVYNNLTGKQEKRFVCLDNHGDIYRVFKLSEDRLISLTSKGFIDQYDLSGKKPAKKLHQLKGLADDNGVIKIIRCVLVKETLFLQCWDKDEIGTVVEAYEIGKYQWTRSKISNQHLEYRQIKGMRGNKKNLFIFFQHSFFCYDTQKDKEPVWGIRHLMDFDPTDTFFSNDGKFMVIPLNQGYIPRICNLKNGHLHQLEDTDFNPRPISFWNDYLVLGIGSFTSKKKDVYQVLTVWEAATGKQIVEVYSEYNTLNHNSVTVLPGNQGILFGRINWREESCNFIPKCLRQEPFQHTFSLFKPSK